MTGWLLIFSLLILGGVLSTLGDRLGSRLGKARLSIFNLRPRRTAILITVLTGSTISALSLGLMLLVSRQLRVGLFELNNLQSKIKIAEKELQQRENNLIALRRGDVVIRSGQILATSIFKLKNSNEARIVIDKLLQKANLEAYRNALPGQRPDKQILLVPRQDIKKLKQIIQNEGTWVVNIRSAANVLLGENLIYAFPEVRPNLIVVNKDEVLAKTTIQKNERSSSQIRNKIKLLLASTLAEAKRKGSLSTRLKFEADAINELGQYLMARKSSVVYLEAVALRTTYTSDNVAIFLRRSSASKENKAN